MADRRDWEVGSAALGAPFAELRQRQAALAWIVHLVLVEDDGRIVMGRAHHVEEQVGDALVDGGLLLAGSP